MSANAAAAAAPRLDADQLAALEEQRDFLLASLADLEREHDAGDLDDDDYAHLRDDYTARAAEVLRAIDSHRDAQTAARRPRRAGRLALVAAAVGLFAVLAGVAVAASLGARQPGQTSSGGITVAETTSQRAQACIPKINTEPPASSIACFKAVLDDDPDNAVALTWLAWDLSLAAGQAPAVGAVTSTTGPGTSSTAGSTSSPTTTTGANLDPGSDPGATLRVTAARLLDRAVASNPGYSFARAFRAVVAYRNGDAASAKRYLADFRANDPSTEAERIIDQEQLDAKITALSTATDPSTTVAD